jgi:hypothetical protein
MKIIRWLLKAHDCDSGMARVLLMSWVSATEEGKSNSSILSEMRQAAEIRTSAWFWMLYTVAFASMAFLGITEKGWSRGELVFLIPTLLCALNTYCRFCGLKYNGKEALSDETKEFIKAVEFVSKSSIWPKGFKGFKKETNLLIGTRVSELELLCWSERIKISEDEDYEKMTNEQIADRKKFGQELERQIRLLGVSHSRRFYFSYSTLVRKEREMVVN